MTQKQLTVQTTIEGARRLQSLIAGVNSSSLGTAETTANEAKSGAVIVQIIDDIEPDNLQPHDAKLIEINGADFAPVPQTTVKIRNLTGAVLSSDSYCVATPVSRWGLCVSSHRGDHAVILDASLPAATHALTGAASALATVCRWSVDDEEYTETEIQIEVWNHSESKDYADDTFGVAKYIDNHWFFFGDCGAMAAREEA